MTQPVKGNHIIAVLLLLFNAFLATYVRVFASLGFTPFNHTSNSEIAVKDSCVGQDVRVDLYISAAIPAISVACSAFMTVIVSTRPFPPLSRGVFHINAGHIILCCRHIYNPQMACKWRLSPTFIGCEPLKVDNHLCLRACELIYNSLIHIISTHSLRNCTVG